MANLISSSISIGSLNKHKFVEILLTACNYYQLQSTSRHIPKRSVIKRLTDSTTSTTSGQTDTRVDRRVLRVDKRVLRMEKQMDRRVLRVDKGGLPVDKQVLRVLLVVKQVL